MLIRTLIAYIVLTASMPAGAQLLASGDISENSAVLWLRADSAGAYRLELALDSGFSVIAAHAVVQTSGDHTAQTEISGLKPATRYYYRVRGKSGPLPRTGSFSTAPAASSAANLTLLFGADLGGQGYGRLRADAGLAVDGWPIFKPMAAENADLFLALGDMIYSDRPISSEAPDYPKGNDFQIPKPGPGYVSNAEDFRRDWFYHRSDHRYAGFLERTPLLATWDDHEIVNDSGGPELVLGPEPAELARDPRLKQGDPSRPRGEFMPWSSTSDPAGRRRSVFFNPVLYRDGRQVMFEYNPIRVLPDPSGRHERRLYRSIRWGLHAELILLDTRSYRDPRYRIDRADQPKTMLGAHQKRWLLERLASSDATWKIVVSSVPLSIEGGNERDPQGHWYRDGWAAVEPDNPYGYARELGEIVKHIQDKRIRNVLFITGDKHYSNLFAYDVDRDGRPDFHEANIGPLRAGVASGKAKIDPTLNPRQLATYAGRDRFAYGRLRIDSQGQLSVEIRDTEGRTVPGGMLDLEPVKPDPG
ncbi:MAG: alkaline phosphatase D family protein [Betaproteobacteria bacterium]|nr:alkaline phosphatase D family protein [Betaproteobacteria bacterium]